MPAAPARAEGEAAFARQLERAEALMAEGREREAIRALQKAAKLAPQPSVRVPLNLAVCFNRLGDFARSGKHARAALEIARTPDEQASAHYLLGLSLAAERPEDAAASLRRVLELSGGAFNLARLRLGEVLAGLGRLEEACAALAGFLELEPVGPKSGRARSVMYAAGCGSPDAELDPDLWTEVRTDNFRVVANGSSDRASAIATGAQRMLAVLAELAPEADLLGGGPISLYGFADQESFAPYRLDTGDAGYLVPHPHGVYAAFGSDEGSIRLIYRQLIVHALEIRFPGLPVWFRQGVAEVYSNLQAGEDGVRLGLPIRSHMWILGALGDEPPIARVLGADAAEAAAMEGFDSWSWAMVHYLSFGGAQLSGKIDEYLRLVAELERPRRAFERAFGLAPEEFGERVIAHVRTRPMPYVRITTAGLATQVNAARELSATAAELALAELALHARPGGFGWVLEDMRQLSREEPETAAVWEVLGEVEALRGNPEAAVTALRRAVELDREAFKAHLLLGGALLEQAQAATGEAAAALFAEAVATLELAVGLRPDSFPVWERLSYAHASQAAPPDRAVEAATRALVMRPGRTDLAYNLLLVRAKRREVDEVRALLRRLEALGATESQVTSSRDAAPPDDAGGAEPHAVEPAGRRRRPAGRGRRPHHERSAPRRRPRLDATDRRRPEVQPLRPELQPRRRGLRRGRLGEGPRRPGRCRRPGPAGHADAAGREPARRGRVLA